MATKTKFDPKNMDTLLSAERRSRLDAQRVISALPIMAHHRVADIGCGPGYFTIPLAKYLFDGKAYALDIRTEMLDATRQSLEAVHLTNVDLMQSKEKQLPLEDASLDGALLSFVLQEANDPGALLKETLRCLRKSGWLAILEWHKRETDGGPPLEQRIDEEEMGALTAKVGFRMAAWRTLNDSQYMVLLRK